MANEMLDGGAVERVAALAREKVQILEMGGRQFSTAKLYERQKDAEPVPPSLSFESLGSLVAYVRSEDDKDYRDKRGQFLIVDNPTQVSLWTGLFGESNQRALVACARPALPDAFPYGSFRSAEELTILVATRFTREGDRDLVTRLLSNVKAERVVSSEDDGLSNIVKSSNGVQRVATVATKAEGYTLRPLRTFHEVGDLSPYSDFLLRLKGGDAEEETLPTAALFETDGGAWRHLCIDRIREYLRDQLGESSAVQVY